MKLFLILLLIALSGAAGWFLRPQFNGGGSGSPHASSLAPGSPASPGARKVLHYQSAMHPWIKSDKPGRCTICGMELTPVYEGEKGFDSTGGENVVALTQSQIQVLHVQTAEAMVRPLTRNLRVAGMVDDNASRHRFLSAYVDSRIDKLHVNFMGAEVSEGQPLADLYSPVLLQAEREYRQVTGELRRGTELRLRQFGLLSAQIAALDKKPADALSSQILAPISGTVVGQSVYEGQYVKAGDKLFEIADFSVMWYQFRAYEQDMPWIQLGQTVTVTTPSLPGRTFEGKITFIDPNFDEATRSTKVRVELPNPIVNGRRELLHRLYADGVVSVETPEALAVPRSAVIQTGPEAVVYLDHGDGAYARAVVTLGRRGDAALEILAGLKAGDRVVTNGNLLIDGQAEMNRSFMSPAEEPMTPATPLAALTSEQGAAVGDFVQVADAMAAALAADDLAAFNRVSEPAMPQTEKMVGALKPFSELKGNLEALNQSRHFHGFPDIKEARAAFHKFALAATAVLEPLRAVKGTPPMKIWECPMVDQAVPNAAKKGRWVQVASRAGGNPFFGKEMLDCVKEIQPEFTQHP